VFRQKKIAIFILGLLQGKVQTRDRVFRSIPQRLSPPVAVENDSGTVAVATFHSKVQSVASTHRYVSDVSIPSAKNARLKYQTNLRFAVKSKGPEFFVFIIDSPGVLRERLRGPHP